MNIHNGLPQFAIFIQEMNSCLDLSAYNASSIEINFR